MNLDLFTAEEVRMIYDSLQKDLYEIEEYIKEIKVVKAHGEIYGADEIISKMVNLKTGEETEEKPEVLIEFAEGSKKEYEVLIAKIKPTIEMIEETYKDEE